MTAPPPGEVAAANTVNAGGGGELPYRQLCEDSIPGGGGMAEKTGGQIAKMLTRGSHEGSDPLPIRSTQRVVVVVEVRGGDLSFGQRRECSVRGQLSRQALWYGGRREGLRNAINGGYKILKFGKKFEKFGML